MDTDTPPHPPGVPFHVAMETLLDQPLLEALRAAEAAPLDRAPLSLLNHTWKPPKLVTLTEADRREHLLRPPREALLNALRVELAAGRILCAGREKGAGAAERRTFAPGDWQHPKSLHTRDWQAASARINGRLYVELLFWRCTAPAPAPRDVAPFSSTASAMPHTGTPTDPSGEPVETAILTLTDRSLVTAYQEADRPPPEADLRRHANELERRELAAEDASFMGPDPEAGTAAYEAKRRARIAGEAEKALRQKRTTAPREALYADFWQRIRDGRIIASCLDPAKPMEDRFDLPAERAVVIGWPNEAGNVAYGNTVLETVRYRAASAVQPQAAPAIPPPEPAKRESAASRAKRLASIIADIQARAAASPERPDESRKEQFARLSVAFPGVTHPEHAEARSVALAAYPAWKRAGRRAG